MEFFFHLDSDFLFFVEEFSHIDSRIHAPRKYEVVHDFNAANGGRMQRELVAELEVLPQKDASGLASSYNHVLASPHHHKCDFTDPRTHLERSAVQYSCFELPQN